MEKLERALCQRIYLLSANNESHESQKIWNFSLKGESKNIYKQKLTSSSFSCSCPDHILKKGFCKHLLFLIARVASLKEIASIVCEYKHKWDSEFFEMCSQQWIKRLSNLGKKPDTLPDANSTNTNNEAIGNDCSVCFEEITKNDNLIQCVSTCKNYFHNDCIQMWLNTGHNTCPLCRATWNKKKDNCDYDDDTGTEIVDGISTSVRINISGTGTVTGVENTNDDIIPRNTTFNDIVFVLETSPCIYPAITQIKNNIDHIVTEYFNMFPNLRIGFINYKQNLDLTSDKSAILGYIKSIDYHWLDTDTECKNHVKMMDDIDKLSWKVTSGNNKVKKNVIIIGDSINHHVHYTPEHIANKLKHRNIRVHAIQGLYYGDTSSYAYYGTFYIMKRYHLFLDQLSMIIYMIMAIGTRLKDCDDNSNGVMNDETRMLMEQIKEEMLAKYGRENISVKLLFDTLMDRFTDMNGVYERRSPWHFASKYKYTTYLQYQINTYNFKKPLSYKDNDGYISYTYELEHGHKKVKPKKQCTLMKYQIVEVTEDSTPTTMYELCNTKYINGGIFYELTKSESIPVDSDIVLVNKMTGELYDDIEAKNMLDLDYIIIKKEDTRESVGAVKETPVSNKIDPNKFAQYRIFVEHNGSRKKFLKGTGFMYRVFPIILKLKIKNEIME